MPLLAQKTEMLTHKADILYQKKEFANAATVYRQAADQKPGDATISYNLGIAEFKAGNYDNSITAFERCVNMTNDKILRSKALYNSGVVFLKKGKLQDAINNLKKSLLLNPGDNESRQNLQIAMGELKKEKQDNKTDGSDKQENNNQPSKPDNQDQEKKEPLNKQTGEQILKALQKKEQILKDSIQQKNGSFKKINIKDW